MQFETSLNQTLLPKYNEKVQIKPLIIPNPQRVFPNRKQHHPSKVQPDLLRSKETPSRELPQISPRASPNELKISNTHRRVQTATNSFWTASPLATPLFNPSSREKSTPSLLIKDFLFTRRPSTIRMVPKTPQIGENRGFSTNSKLPIVSSHSKDAVNLEKFIFGERITIDDDANPFDKPVAASLCTSRATKKST